MSSEAVEATAAIEVVGVWKRYSRDLRAGQRNALAAIGAELTGSDERDDLRAGEFWALRDLNLTVAPGEALGIVGRNGAGKSTLLRLVAGITRPSRGEVVRRASVGALLDPLAGFNPILSGRENADVAFTLVRGERPTTAELDEVFAYAQIASAEHHPVRTYSQGMRVRLAFAVMVIADPDVLVIDEALAVGDTSFQLQCLDHLHAFRRAGGSLLFTSHSMWAFQHLATRGLHLERGELRTVGSPEDVADAYLTQIRAEATEELGDGPDILDRERVRRRAPAEPEAEAEPEAAPAPDPTARPVRFVSIEVGAADGGPVRHGGETSLRVEVDAAHAYDSVTLGYMIWTADLSVCVLADISHDVAGPGEGFALPAGRSVLRCTIDDLPLLPGPYAVRAAVYHGVHGDVEGMTGFEDAPWWFDVAADPDAPERPSGAGTRLRPLRTLPARLA